MCVCMCFSNNSGFLLLNLGTYTQYIYIYIYMVKEFFFATKKGVEPDFFGREQGGNPSFPSYSLLKKRFGLWSRRIFFAIW